MLRSAPRSDIKLGYGFLILCLGLLVKVACLFNRLFEEMLMKLRAVYFLKLFGAIWLVCLLGTAAMAQIVTAGANANPMDYKILYATPQDVAQGKQVAITMCASCHGVSGISSQKGVPNIAGQRPVYMHLELKAYQAGKRANTTMTNTVKYMNDDAIMNVSAYYASQDSADPMAVPAKAAASKPNALSVGKAAAVACGGCHGEVGVSKMAGMPSLIGLDPKYFVAAINAYKGGQRKHDMMKELVSELTEAEIISIALYYALQTPDKAKTPAVGNVAAGKTAAASCSGCHGDSGVSANPATPSLAGQEAQYFVTAMSEYKKGSRTDATMKGPATAVDEVTAKNLAAYYAGQTPKAPQVGKPLSVAEWAERCDRCHGVSGNSTDPRAPSLAAQRAEYLERVMLAYKKGERKSKEMAAMSESLDDELIAGLAAHYAQKKARGLAYMILPLIPINK
jgi:cytochrome c553